MTVLTLGSAAVVRESDLYLQRLIIRDLGQFRLVRRLDQPETTVQIVDPILREVFAEIVEELFHSGHQIQVR